MTKSLSHICYDKIYFGVLDIIQNGIGVSRVIETIYSNENGETKPANRVQTSFKMPKNVRQVGRSNPVKKIYVEDYVMTYIKQLAGGDYSKCKLAVLVGQCIKLDNCRNIFISGAVEVNNIDTTYEIVFSNDTWTGIYEDIKKYFVETEIVGWFIGGPGYLLEDEEKILKAHVDNFAGQDKTLLTYDSMEKEEVFLSYENNRLCKQEGYYIYYEKNEEMQSYMIDHKSVQSIEESYDDRVSRDIRTVLQSKKPPEEENKNFTRLMYAAGTLLAVIVLVVGAAMLDNYDQMKSMQQTLNYLSRNMEEVQAIFTEDKASPTMADVQAENAQAEDADSSEGSDTEASEDSLDVEVVPGDVKPLEDTKDQDDNEDNNDSTSDVELADEDSNTEKVADSQEDKETVVVQDKVNYYTVESGDTLAGISYKLYQTYTKVDKIMKLNNIKDQDVILVGQRLIVP
jgi:LysM repeat protein